MKTIALAFLLAIACVAARAENKSDMWWNPAQSGRGLIVIDHETDMFLVWCTYDAGGFPTWFVIPGGTLSADRRTFSGNYFATFDADDDNPATAHLLGTATLDFSPSNPAAGSARFSIDVGGTIETHDVQRQPFGSAAPAWGADATDMWWDPNDSGSGVAVIQHGVHIFAVVLTYQYTGGPTFHVISARLQTASNPVRPSESDFAGQAYRTAIEPYVYEPGGLSVHDMGPTVLAFTNEDGRPIELVMFNRPLVRLPFGAKLSPTPPAASKGSR